MSKEEDKKGPGVGARLENRNERQEENFFKEAGE